ncbi:MULTISPECIES: hypothetical protein [unclassified Clostridium]|uniref:hypothetical protein n=1 Tax=unclassified Clostridium TaxID=2614128 RepID=UPI0025C00F2D|nr:MULTISPECIES: hypothetical protein [unclassified Clostridium]
MLRKSIENFINVLEGKEVIINSKSYKIEDGKIVNGNNILNLNIMNEYELEDLQDQLASEVLLYLKETYLGKEIKILDLDNEMLELVPRADSVFDCNTREKLESDGFCYQYDYDNPSGFNFIFEIMQDSDDILHIEVKIIDIGKI